MKFKEVLWIVLSALVLEFDLGGDVPNIVNVLEWLLIDVPLLLGLYWFLCKRSEPLVLKGLNDG